MLKFNEELYIGSLLGSAKRQFHYGKALETGDWCSWRSAFRTKLAELTGLDQVRECASGLPLNARRLETMQFDTYTREKWLVQTEPGIDIPFYLLLPAGDHKVPLVLTPHGHGPYAKELYVDNVSEKVSNETSENVAVQGVREGYAVIAPDVRGFGEMANIAAGSSKQNSCHEFQRIAMMFGRTLVGERVHDMGRLIDFAGTVDRIDTSRIAVTGHSGGGTVTLFTAALDDRITVAAPSCYFNMFETSIIPISHCPCNLVPGMMHAGEMYDVAGLFAPRPVLFINGEKDTIYPIEGARQAFEHVKRIYQGMEVPDRCKLYVGNEGHRYYNERTWSFMKEWL